MDRARELIERLGLIPHPERGFYVETYRAPLAVAGLPHGGARAASTAIYFLVTRAQPTTYLHRLKSDEVFHLYEGGPLDVLLLGADAGGEVRRLGVDVAAGERPQLVIPAGTWFAVELAAGSPPCSGARSRLASTSPTSSWPRGPSWRRATRRTPRASRA